MIYHLDSGRKLYVIPIYMRNGLREYVEQGVPPGDFLRNILKNDLAAAVNSADQNNVDNIPAYAAWLHSIPLVCWGCEEAINDWIRQGGLYGNKTPADDQSGG